MSSTLQYDLHDFVCTFHRVKKIAAKDAAINTQLQQKNSTLNEENLTNEQRGEQMNRLLYKILHEIEQRIVVLPSSSEPATSDYFDEWAFLTWSLLSIINRLQRDVEESHRFLDYEGKHFQEKIHAALVDLVNKAQRMQSPLGVQQSGPSFDRFYQSYVSALISLHELYTMSQQQWISVEFESQIQLFKEQLTVCFQFQRDFCNEHRYYVWQQLRSTQVHKMTKFGYTNKNFLSAALSFYTHMLYNLGVLTARLQVTMGLASDTRNSKGFTKAELIQPLLQMVYAMTDMLICDSIVCIEPSQNPILVTNNLFAQKVVALSQCLLFKRFQFQIVSEEVANQIQQDLRRKSFDPMMQVRETQSAALLAIKPSTGVKRNNATASTEGGNTAHKKSDVNSKEWISIPPSFDPATQSWTGTYPHLLCTTRQKDALLDTRSATQTGKRPLFYFHVKAEIFGFTGTFQNAHTLSMPFAIATRRNQDCQVQRMMSSYTATCFWLYGTASIDGLLLQWFENGIEWRHFKELYAQYFSVNAEVDRSLCEEDFNVLENKMHCSECEEPYHLQTTEPQSSLITFKHVLCPHLHYQVGKTDVRFSVWRGMLELLHLFSDSRTELKNMWECGLLLGFMERERVNTLLSKMESGMIMHLSFIVGGCVLLNVKTGSGNQILNLEPLDLKRLQSKSLHEYLRDVLIAEKVEYIFNSNNEWISVDDAMKLCQKSTDAYHPTEREITSNVTHSGKISINETLKFIPMRVAVVTCKSQTNPEELAQEIPTLPTYTNEEFENSLEKLMYSHGKTRMDVVNLLNRKAISTAVVSPVQPPTISCVQLASINSTSRQIQPVYHSSPQHHITSSSNEQQEGFQPPGVSATSLLPTFINTQKTFLEFAGRQPRIIAKTFDDQVASLPLVNDPLGHFQHQTTVAGLQFWPTSSTTQNVVFYAIMHRMSIGETDKEIRERARSINSTQILNWEPETNEKDLIRLTWSDDFNFLYELGADIYVYIFEKMPECKTLFPKIHQHGDNYKNSKEFRSQSLKFVQVLAHTVKAIYHINDLAVYLRKIGEMHLKFSERGFKADHWDIFLDAIETVMAQKIASLEKFDDEQRACATRVWRRLAFYIVIQMKCGYYNKLQQSIA